MKILSQLVTSIATRNPNGWLSKALAKWSQAIPAGASATNAIIAAPAEIQAVHSMTSIPKIIKIGAVGFGLAAALAYGKKLWHEATSRGGSMASSHNPITERGIDMTFEDYLAQNYSVLLNRFSQAEILALECLCINAIFMRPGEFTKLHMENDHFEDHRESIVRMRAVALSSWKNTHHKISYAEYSQLIETLVDQNYEESADAGSEADGKKESPPDEKKPPNREKMKETNPNAVIDALNRYKNKNKG